MLISRLKVYPRFIARVVKLADTPDLGSGAVRREGSSPSPSTTFLNEVAQASACEEPEAPGLDLRAAGRSWKVREQFLRR